MKKFLFLAAVVALAQSTGISGERIRAHVKFLSSDLLEGRGVGARGGDLATEYIATQFALVGAKPAGDNGTYFQNFTLMGVEPPAHQHSKSGLDHVPLARRFRRRHLSAENRCRVRCGRGVRRPRHRRAGIPVGRLPGIDVRGKVVVLFTSEPPSNDPKFFTGARADLLRPLDLQIRRSRAPRSHRRDHHSHHADGQLWMGRGAVLLGARRSAGETRAGRASVGARRHG